MPGLRSDVGEEFSPLPEERIGEPPGSGRAHWIFGTPADAGLAARARDAATLVEELVCALFELLTDPEKVQARDRRTVRTQDPDPGTLLVRHLTEILTLHETEDFVARDCRTSVVGAPPRELSTTLRGEPFDPSRHPSRVAVKAITYHRLAVDWKAARARVIVDI